jgi:L-ascorbate metabolism protein UlaG (beta-lactamase superfamily)
MHALKKDILDTELLPTQSALWYLGQEGFLIKNDGTYILIDPYLSEYVDKNCCELVEWRRLYPTPIDPCELDFIDLVICTHAHYDHADPYTLSAIAGASREAKFIVPAPIIDTFVGYGIEKERIISAVSDTPIAYKKTNIVPVPAAHEELHADEFDNYFELSYIIENPSGRLFHGGDMCLYPDLEKHLKGIDVAMLPINGRDFYRGALDIIGNLTAEEAILLSKRIDAKLLVPMHYDLYEVNRVSETMFINALERLNPKQRHHEFIPSEKYIFMK